MNIKTVSSAYFIPLPKNAENGDSITDWLNLARITSIEINQEYGTAKVYCDNQYFAIYEGRSFEILKKELDHLYSSNTRQQG